MTFPRCTIPLLHELPPEYLKLASCIFLTKQNILLKKERKENAELDFARNHLGFFLFTVFVFTYLPQLPVCFGRRGGLMVSALDSGASSLGSSPGRDIVFLGKTLNSHSASLHPGATETGISSGSYEPALAPRLHFTSPVCLYN